MTPRKAQLGFGLGFHPSFFDTIVLPILIVGILALVAIPSFNNYLGLSRVSKELAEVAAPARAAVEKAFITRGPTDMSRRSSTGWLRPGFRQYLQSADIGKDGTITLRFTSEIAAQAENQIQIVPVSGGKPLDLSQATNAGLKFEWQCGGAAGKTTLPEKFRPKECRGSSAAQ